LLNFKTTISGLLAIVFCNLSIAQTKLIKTNEGFELHRNGAPYYVKGVGGEVNFDLMIEIGANSFRTWGIDNAEKILDEAQSRGLTVMLGFWLQHERHGFDYDNAEKVKKQFNHFKAAIDKFKNHPALLMWGIGNELDLEYTNPNVWYAVQDLAKYAHQVDPNHPTSTVTAGLDSSEVSYIKARCPDIDIYCINTYGDIGNVPTNIKKFGWDGAYMITEWGPNGHWESPQTAWKVSIEQSSTEKYDVYLNRFKKYIEPNKNYCLGSYAFLWGAKQEYTETWYGLFSKENLPTEPIDALQEVFTQTPIAKPAAKILNFSIDEKTVIDNIKLKAQEKYKAKVDIQLPKDINENQVKYRWRVLEESSDKKSGGDVEEEATEINGLILKGSKMATIVFRAPQMPGNYRLLVSATCNGKVSYTNLPFQVFQREATDKQVQFIKAKYTDMKDFDHQKSFYD
jgi:hypothetical protein